MTDAIGRYIGYLAGCFIISAVKITAVMLALHVIDLFTGGKIWAALDNENPSLSAIALVVFVAVHIAQTERERP